MWNGVIPVDFRRIWEDADRGRIGSSPVFVPDVHDMIIVSTVNVFRKPFLALKSMVELDELVRLGSDLDWTVLAKKAHDYRCGTLVYAALHAARAVLGGDHLEAGLRTLRPRALSRRAPRARQPPCTPDFRLSARAGPAVPSASPDGASATC